MKNFVVYKSSAGSGKTFTLVKEFLRLSLYDEKQLAVNFRRILAITFTNKAASEMKNRVIDALHDIAHSDIMPATGKMICGEIGIEAGELKRRAGIVLKNVLHHYADLSIGTIDSFTHRIVRTFAFDLQLPANFNVETDTGAFYEKVVAMLFNKIGEDPYVSKLLKEFTISKAEDEGGWDPENQLKEFAFLLQKENAPVYIEKLSRVSAEELGAIRVQLFDFIRNYKKFLKEESAKATDLIRERGLGDSDFRYKGGGPQNFFHRCFQLDVTITDTEGKRIVDAITNNAWAAAGVNSDLAEIIPQLNETARSLIGFIRENYAYYSLCLILSRQMYPLMLLKKIEEISAEQKEEDRIVFIGDFNRKVSEVIRNEPAPFIYERLGERYRHYLVDEFQDTSSLQWHNLIPLLDNSLANGWYNMLAGDGKQSIYRWRNANVLQFACLPEIDPGHGDQLLAERAGALSRNFEARLLDTNYRSLLNIVNFNNVLFNSLSAGLLGAGGHGIYRDNQQKPKGSDSSGGWVTLDSGKKEKEMVDGQTCSLIMNYIKTALDYGFSHRDICILFRTNEKGTLVANFLADNRIPVISSDSLLLKNNPEVHVVIAWLKYLEDNADNISAAVVVNYLRSEGRLDEQTTHRFLSRIAGGEPLSTVLSSVGIEVGNELKGSGNILDNCIGIISALELNRKGSHYLRFFLDEVLEFITRKNAGTPGFFEWWEERSGKASLVIPENTDAVRIMTIHSGKGLEFPVVIVPYCNWPVFRSSENWVNIPGSGTRLPVGIVNLSIRAADAGFGEEVEREKQDQLLDNLNLLYVAFTRAVERLHIITLSSSGSKQPGVAQWVEQFFEAQEGTKAEHYESGSPAAKKTTAKHSLKPTYQLDVPDYRDPANKIRVKAAFPTDGDNLQGAWQKGVVMHALLSAIATEEDIKNAVDQAVISGMINSGESSGYSNTLKEIVTHPALSELFSKGNSYRLESELITAFGEVLRPDRVVISDETVTIIDYKTGKESNAHAHQLKKYDEALMSMGYKNVRKLLVYLSDMKITEL